MATEQKQFTVSQLLTLPPPKRMPTGFAIIDKALGGGPVEGTLNLLTAPGGVGKSTLMLQLALVTGLKTVYVSSEEAPEHLQARALRLTKGNADALRECSPDKRLVIVCEKDAAKWIRTCEAFRPRLLILDSLQATHPTKNGCEPGSGAALLDLCDDVDAMRRKWGMTAFLIGQVNKDKRMAGPEKVRHYVDAHLEMDESRLLTVSKNRYGEAPVKYKLSMEKTGLKSLR